MNKKVISATILLILTVMIIISIGNKSNKESTAIKTYDSISLSSKLPILYNEGSFLVDVEKPEEIVGWGDYVFVAAVEEELRTEYTNIRENEDGTITGKPYTVYSITVLDNLKGNLKTDEPIEFFKHGGVSYDGKSISLLEGDQLLEAGKQYILIAAAETDGRLGQGMPYSAIELNINNRAKIESSKEYENYKKYIENEVIFERARFQSTDEE